jgi:3-deoxy-manno-octulosonate cytidylyltransferase (CMP-KDO synthetase)
MSVRNQAFAPHPSHDQISVCPCSGNPYKCTSFRPIPIISGLLSTGAKTFPQDRTLMTEPRILVLIPARMAATRLPGKPLLDIGGLPMIVHVLRRAQATGIGRVAVATDTPEIATVVTAHGFEAVMTRADHPSGSDRIYEALGKLDPGRETEIVINLQGDFPTILPGNIRDVLAPLADPAVDIATLAAEIHTEEEALNPNVVKVIGSPITPKRLRALYFTRATAPWGDGPRYHHIGLYAYRRAALERFVALAPSVLEQREKLEQLRAIEAGMRIDVTIVDTVPRGVDTPADLETARRALAPRFRSS